MVATRTSAGCARFCRKFKTFGATRGWRYVCRGHSVRVIKTMRLCVVTFKQCWQDQRGRWLSYGGFPGQMGALGSLFDELTLVIVRGRPQGRGMPLPAHAEIIPLRSPAGEDFRRKLSVAAHL